MRIFVWLFIALLSISCSPSKNGNGDQAVNEEPYTEMNAVVNNDDDGVEALHTNTQIIASLVAAMHNAELPDDMRQRLLEAATTDDAFFTTLFECLAEEPDLWRFVDKQISLPRDFVPSGLVTLDGGSFTVTRAGMTLQSAAYDALEEMASAARAQGVSLVAGSTYRSYDYQVEVYDRWVRQLGQIEADRVSARPGHSQHQIGTVVDFAPIENTFAQSAAGRFVAENASRFGWSLSYPEDYEPITGYSWESWHYRYVGKTIAAFIDEYFDGIQHYALHFLHEWDAYASSNASWQ
jgi:D-alanyl-D-alanine carboxypeptidase